MRQGEEEIWRNKVVVKNQGIGKQRHEVWVGISGKRSATRDITINSAASAMVRQMWG